MARGASGISGLVYGISVNVKHTFLRRKKKKRINGKGNLKERKKRGETVTPACSQNAPEFYQSSLQASIHCGTRQTPLPSNRCNCQRER